MIELVRELWFGLKQLLSCLGQVMLKCVLGGATREVPGWWVVLNVMRSLGTLKPVWLITLQTVRVMKHFISMYN